jgi:hypothetical protein
MSSGTDSERAKTIASELATLVPGQMFDPIAITVEASASKHLDRDVAA